MALKQTCLPLVLVASSSAFHRLSFISFHLFYLGNKHIRKKTTDKQDKINKQTHE